MKARVWYWVLVVAGGFGLAVWQGENLVRVVCEYLFELRYDLQSKETRPVLSAKDKAVDSEAAAMVEIIFYRGDRDAEFNLLARYVMEYPENEYFLYQLASEFFQPDLPVDSQIKWEPSNRLLELGPDNALYHYSTVISSQPPNSTLQAGIFF